MRSAQGNPDLVLYGIMAANLGVYGMWHTLNPRFMHKHFTVSYESLTNLRLHTLVTSGFSQFDTWHLAGNMFTFFFFGRAVAHRIGSRGLMRLYLLAAVACSISHVAVDAYRKGDLLHRSPWASLSALGASGSVNAAVVLSCCLQPHSRVLLMGVLPLPAWLVGIAWLLYDITGAASNRQSGIGHAGHLGGALVGLAYYLKLNMPRGLTRFRRR